MRTKLRLIAVFLMSVLGIGVGVAQNAGTETTDTRVSIDGIKGSTPESLNNGDVHTRPGGPSTSGVEIMTEDQMKKVCFLYNVTLHEALYSGQTYGVEAALAPVGHFLWIENAQAGAGGTYSIHSTMNVSGDLTGSTNGYLRYNLYSGTISSYGSAKTENPPSWSGRNNNQSLVYLDHRADQPNSGWNFEKVTTGGYSADDNVYKIYTTDPSTSGTKQNWKYYLLANPNRLSNGGYWIGVGTKKPTDAEFNDPDGYWKLISLYDYYQMFKASASSLVSPLDATFLISDASFHVNDRYLQVWNVEGGSFQFGLDNIYKTSEKRGTDLTAKDYYGMDGSNYRNYVGAVQQNYGEDYFAYTKSNATQRLYQDIQVTQDGWYILRCNGFSTLNTVNADGTSTTSAALFAQEGTDADGDKTRVTQALNAVSSETVNTLLAPPDAYRNNTNYRGAQVGQEFAKGNYINQLMIRVTNASESSPATLRIGINIDGTNAAQAATPYTAVDNFRLLYAGHPAASDLILDEEDEAGLDTLVKSTDDYTNATLHLKRSFTLGKWNTIVLPVSLTAGQVRQAFGSDVRLAYLKNLTANSLQFERVDPATDDNGQGIVAYMPYIIKPTKNPGVTASYTTAALSGLTGYTKNTMWVGPDHYIIPMVTLDNDAMGRLGTSKAEGEWSVNHTTWETIWTGNGQRSSTLDKNYINAIGTMSKTWNTKDASGNATTPSPKENRGGKAGDYYMSGGQMWVVPQDKVYPLKAFRVWFRPGADVATAKLSAWLDDEPLEVHDGGTATGIDGITFSEPKGVVSNGDAEKNGVYTVTGQRVRENASTVGLPSGVYVVAGKKVMVK